MNQQTSSMTTTTMNPSSEPKLEALVKSQPIRELRSGAATLATADFSLDEATNLFRRIYIENVLESTRTLSGYLNVCKAARQLGIHRNTLSRAIAELNINVKRLKEVLPWMSK